MAIDISALQLPKGTLARNTEQKINYKLDGGRAKAALQAAKEAGEPQDLLELSGVTARDLQQLKEDAGQQGVITVISGYGADMLFRPEMPEAVNANGTYTVSGTTFTTAELQEARSLMQRAADSISAGPGKNTNLDYRNYAQMAIAQNAVDTYAAAHFGKDQAAALSSAMQEYNTALMDMQNTILGSTGDSQGYYGRAHTLTQGEADMLNAFKKELSAMTGRSFRLSHAGDSGGYDQIATNKSQISEITKLFGDADLSSTSGRNAAMQRYAELMRPVYMEQGIRSSDLDRVLNNDWSRLMQGFDNILKSAGHVSIEA